MPQGAWSQDQDPAGLPVHVHDGPEGLWALHGRCTHQGDPALRLHDRLHCPTCGSTWDARGQPLDGPATQALRRLEVARLPAEGGGGYRVDLPDTTWTLPAERVLLALDPPALARLAGPVLPAARALTGVPFAVARFWLDRPVDPRRPAAALLPRGRHATLALLAHRLQDASAAWAARSGGSVVELQAGRDLPAEQSPGWSQALLDALHPDLALAWPELAGAAVLKARLVRGGQRVHLGPGHAARALPMQPGPPGLWLAGEVVALSPGAGSPGDGPAPLLWERAVRTGRAAAADLLAGAAGP
ncbi:Rieske 2Fe-2S domain-containing protein [Myxococcota bacterium]|nr:Rieske 2Fe-2S domain-containing protein [Myxococcota bacterium]